MLSKKLNQKQNWSRPSARDSHCFLDTWVRESGTYCDSWKGLWKERFQKTIRDDSWQSFFMAWKVVSTQIYIYCWRSQNVKKHDCPNQSAVHFILILPELIYVIICLLCWICKIWVLFWTVFISFVTENYSNLSLVCSSKGWCLYSELAPRIHHPLTFSILYVFIGVGWCSLLSKVTSVSSINPRMI